MNKDSKSSIIRATRGIFDEMFRGESAQQAGMTHGVEASNEEMGYAHTGAAECEACLRPKGAGFHCCDCDDDSGEDEDFHACVECDDEIFDDPPRESPNGVGFVCRSCLKTLEAEYRHDGDPRDFADDNDDDDYYRPPGGADLWWDRATGEPRCG